MATPLQASTTAVVGYFASGDEAHRAINALIESGFSAGEIGAAFHVGSASSQHAERDADVGGTVREAVSTDLEGEHGGKVSQSNSLSSAASGTSAVQFGKLGPGSGTPYSGPHKPGPITGSDLSNTGLPSELKSSLPHEADLREGREGSWSSRLEPVFRGSSAKTAPTKESQNFGTGEGSLNLTGTRPYSREHFERSFSEYGVEQEHARTLSDRIGHGGAVITVHASERAEEAERILEANGGRVRFSPESTQEDYSDYEDSAAGDAGVEVFGRLGQNYPHNVK